jgi:hypothetical protein
MSSQASDPLVRLKRELGKCADAFDPAAEDAGRASAIMSLVAIGEFLTAVFGTGLSTPLRQLQYALHDLDGGKVVPLLEPMKVAHRPAQPVGIKGFRAVAAAAMELMIQAGVGRKEAARQVARKLSQLGYDDGPGRIITADRVEDWRDHVLTERPAEDVGAARFQRLKDRFAGCDPSKLKTGADLLLERLPLAVPIPKKPPS